MSLSKWALIGWNARQPRAIGIAEPSNLPAQELHMERVNGVRYVPTWDEDDRSEWQFHRKLVNKSLNNAFWPREEHERQFNSIEDMIS